MPSKRDDTTKAEHDLLEELHTSEARFRAICETAPLGIYVSEIPVGVVYVNPAMRRILGRTEEELLGEGWKRFLHPDDAVQTLGTRAGNYDRAAAMDVKSRYVRSDGQTIWTHLRAAPVIRDGELRGYVGLIEDTTEQKALQAQLVTAERLASVGTLAAGVAHEVNTPLAVALANLEWAQRRVAAQVARLEQLDAPPAAAVLADLRALITPLEHAHDAASRVSHIVKDLGTFSRPETSDEDAADLGRVLRSAIRMASHELKHRARLVDACGELPWVQGSEARLGQVFLNLLINAAHSIPEGRVRDHEVRVSARMLEPGTVAVEVRDTGTGIAPEVMGNIFDPFFTTKDRRLCTGLGLAVCHRIVTAVGGRIEVESQVGKGSVFRVLLQTADAVSRPAPEAGSLPAARAQGPRPRVLVIDDDEMLLSSIALSIEERCDAVTTTSAQEALDRLDAGECFDAIFCDLMMEGMDGIQFHAELGQNHPELAQEVIFITGGAVTPGARAFLEGVPNRRLGKPFALDDLHALIPPVPASDGEVEQ